MLEIRLRRAIWILPLLLAACDYRGCLYSKTFESKARSEHELQSGAASYPLKLSLEERYSPGSMSRGGNWSEGHFLCRIELDVDASHGGQKLPVVVLNRDGTTIHAGKGDRGVCEPIFETTRLEHCEREGAVVFRTRPNERWRALLPEPLPVTRPKTGKNHGRHAVLALLDDSTTACENVLARLKSAAELARAGDTHSGCEYLRETGDEKAAVACLIDGKVKEHSYTRPFLQELARKAARAGGFDAPNLEQQLVVDIGSGTQGPVDGEAALYELVVDRWSDEAALHWRTRDLLEICPTPERRRSFVISRLEVCERSACAADRVELLAQAAKPLKDGAIDARLAALGKKP